jgi:signal transduction histidine kinase
LRKEVKKVKKRNSKKEHALVEVLQPTATTAFDEAKQQVEALPSLRLPTSVRTVSDQQLVVDILRQVASANKTVEAKRKSVTTHLDAAKKALNKLFKPLQEHLANIREDLEGKLNEYRDWQELMAEVEREKLRKKAETQRKRTETLAAKKLQQASTPQEARRIKQAANAKLATQEAILEAKVSAVDDIPDAEEGVAVIEDYEITDLDISQVPECGPARQSSPTSRRCSRQASTFQG